jgi:hypothetical protein
MTKSAMSADRFRQIIERAARSDGDPDAHAEALRVALRELSAGRQCYVGLHASNSLLRMPRSASW